MVGHYQHALRVYCCLSIIRLLKTATGNRHDARLLIRQVDLIRGGRTGYRSLGLFAPRLLTGCLLLVSSLDKLFFVLLALLGIAFCGTAFNLSLGLAIFLRRLTRISSSSGMFIPSGTASVSAARPF